MMTSEDSATHVDYTWRHLARMAWRVIDRGAAASFHMVLLVTALGIALMLIGHGPVQFGGPVRHHHQAPAESCYGAYTNYGC